MSRLNVFREGAIIMKKKNIVSLIDMQNGQLGKVSVTLGGIGFTNKLDALGVRKGANIIKKSAFLAQGPIVILVGGTELAIGYGMASKIMVEV